MKKVEIEFVFSDVTPKDRMTFVKMGVCRELGGIRVQELIEHDMLEAEVIESFKQALTKNFDKLVDIERIGDTRYVATLKIIPPKELRIGELQ